MARILKFRGSTIKEEHVVIGNHSNARMIINGDFSISGLVHCPRYRLDLIIKGNGKISLHGICKKLNLIKVKGNCELNFTSLVISELNCREMIGYSLVTLGKVKSIGERNFGDSDFYRDGLSIVANVEQKVIS